MYIPCRRSDDLRGSYVYLADEQKDAAFAEDKEDAASAEDKEDTASTEEKEDAASTEDISDEDEDTESLSTIME